MFSRMQSLILPSLVVLALLTPLAWSFGGSTVPLIFSGDEPHYLLAINSIIHDGDLDLANNYASVHRGSKQAGANFAATAISHQTVWFENGTRRNWEDVYNVRSEGFGRDAEGHPKPELLPGQPAPPDGHPEYSQHPPGLALLLSPVLYVFRGTEWVEAGAVTCSAMAVIAAFLLFRALIASFAIAPVTADLVAVTAFLGSPAWSYGRTLFSEPYLLLCAVAAYSFGLRGRPLLAGIFIGVGILMKPPFALLFLPLATMYLVDRDVRSALKIAIPVGLGIVVLFGLNTFMFGSPLRAAQAWLGGSVIRGSIGMLVSPRYGALFVAPAAVLALALWPAFIRRYPKYGIVLASAILSYFLLAASWRFWNGATAYAARIVVPVVPLMFVSLIVLPELKLWTSRPARIGAISICLLSIAINGFAAMPYWENWDSNPPLRLAQFIGAKLGQ